MENHRDGTVFAFNFSFVVRGPAVFSYHVAVVLHGVFVVLHQQQLGAEQTCLLVDCDPLVNSVFWFSLPLWADEFDGFHAFVIASSVALAAVQACVVVVDRH